MLSYWSPTTAILHTIDRNMSITCNEYLRLFTIKSYALHNIMLCTYHTTSSFNHILGANVVSDDRHIGPTELFNRAFLLSLIIPVNDCFT